MSWLGRGRQRALLPRCSRSRGPPLRDNVFPANCCPDGELGRIQRSWDMAWWRQSSFRDKTGLSASAPRRASNSGKRSHVISSGRAPTGCACTAGCGKTSRRSCFGSGTWSAYFIVIGFNKRCFCYPSSKSEFPRTKNVSPLTCHQCRKHPSLRCTRGTYR